MLDVAEFCETSAGRPECGADMLVMPELECDSDTLDMGTARSMVEERLRPASIRCARESVSSGTCEFRALSGRGPVLMAVAKEAVVEATELTLARDTLMRISSAPRWR